MKEEKNTVETSNTVSDTEKKIEQLLSSSENTQSDTSTESDSIEKQSYSRHSYKAVKKLRFKGALMGIQVPYLKYPVKRTGKPKPLLLVLAILSLLLLAGAIAICVYFSNTLLIPLFQNLTSTTKTLTTQYKYDILGIMPMIGGLSSFFLWSVFIILILILVTLVVIFTFMTKKMFNLSFASIQEVAVGHEMNTLRNSLIGSIAVFVFLPIFFQFTGKELPTKGIIAMWLICGIIIAIFGVILAFVLIEKHKAKKVFDTLPQEEQDDYLEHSKALEKISTRRKRKSTIFPDNLGLDF